MLLTLSSKNVHNTSASGQPLYVSSTPRHFSWTTTIKKYIADDFQLEMKDRFEVAAQIRWRIFCPAKFRIGGRSLRSDSFLQSMGSLGGILFVYSPPSCAEGGIVEGGHSGVLTVGDIGGTCIVVSWWYVPLVPMTHRVV